MRKLTYPKLVIYCILFFAFWTFKNFVFQPIMDEAFTELTAELIGSVMKLLSWTAPALILIRAYREDMWVPLKGLFTNKPDWQSFWIVFGGFLAFQIFQTILQFGKIGIHPNFNPIGLIGTVLIVGITEEVVFRGWLLSAFLRKMNRNTATTVNAILFLLIHFPLWYCIGAFADPFNLLQRCIQVFLLSNVFSWVFMRGKSLVTPIILHMFWNLLVCILMGG